MFLTPLGGAIGRSFRTSRQFWSHDNPCKVTLQSFAGLNFSAHFMTFRIIWAEHALSRHGHVAISRPRRDNVSFRFMHVATATVAQKSTYIYICLYMLTTLVRHLFTGCMASHRRWPEIEFFDFSSRPTVRASRDEEHVLSASSMRVSSWSSS